MERQLADINPQKDTQDIYTVGHTPSPLSLPPNKHELQSRCSHQCGIVCGKSQHCQRQTSTSLAAIASSTRNVAADAAAAATTTTTTTTTLDFANGSTTTTTIVSTLSKHNVPITASAGRCHRFFVDSTHSRRTNMFFKISSDSECSDFVG